MQGEAHSISISKAILNLDPFEFAKDRPAFCNHIVSAPRLISKDDFDKFTSFFPLAFSAIFEKGYFCFWFPIETLGYLTKKAKESGFLVQPWPLIAFQKDYPRKHNENPDTQYPPGYQSLLICRKPGTVLFQRQGQGCYAYNARLTLERYQTTRPMSPSVWRWLYHGIAAPGHILWDPFAQDGVSIVAAIMHKLAPLATEADHDLYLLCLQNIKNHFHSKLGENIIFK